MAGLTRLTRETLDNAPHPLLLSSNAATPNFLSSFLPSLLFYPITNFDGFSENFRAPTETNIDSRNWEEKPPPYFLRLEKRRKNVALALFPGQ